ncbi:hypothetical protein GmHk_04G010781 [Glycine max]|nr:hypothetical protein GmHk_04G010781 [Glycine max]
MPLYIERRDLLEVYMGTKMFNITVVQLWLMYLHCLCSNMENAQIYGFMDPQSIWHAWNKIMDIHIYLQNRLHLSKKQCYLAPYLHSSNLFMVILQCKNHRQLLILCPNKNVVVLLCSLYKKQINQEMRTIIEFAMDGYQRLVSVLSASRRKPTWILSRAFNNRSPMPKENITNIQQRLANFFHEVVNV